MRPPRSPHGALRRAAGRMARCAPVTVAVATGAVACALAASASSPPRADAAPAPRLIHAHRVNSAACVAGPAGTARARVRLWMSVVNYHGLFDWADHMEAKVRLEATGPGTNIGRRWASWKTPYLLQDTRHLYNMSLVTDNVSAAADWRVHLKLIWHRSAPIANVTRHVYLPYDGSCGVWDGTGGGSLPAAPAPPSVGAG